MDFDMQQAIGDYFKNQKQQPLYDPSEYGKTEVANPNWAATPKIESFKPQQAGSVNSNDDIASYTSAATSVINIIAQAALSAEQNKVERELYDKKKDLDDKIFSGKSYIKEKQNASNNRVEANRSTFGASDLGIKTASNQNSINSNGVNSIVNALARAYLNKG